MFNIVDLNFLFGPERDSLQEQFFNEDHENSREQEKSSRMVREAVEE